MNEIINRGGKGPNAPEPEDGLRELDVGFVLSTIKNYRTWILSCSAAFLATGLIYAFFSAPVYMSIAIVAPKEMDKRGGASSLLSQFGGIGGIVASQFGLGNANLDRMEIMLSGHELAETVIRKHNLMPVLFPKKWDSEKKEWRSKKPESQPRMADAIEKLQNGCVATSVNAKKGVLTVQGFFNNPEMARQLVDHYLVALNERIRSDVKKEAEHNKKYLEDQLAATQDPIFREKLNNLISYELEKAMLVSHQSFDIISKPTLPINKVKPKRKIIAIVALFGGLFISILSALFMNLLRQSGARAARDEQSGRV